MDRWPRNKRSVSELVSLYCGAQTTLRTSMESEEQRETWRGCHINKADDITSWKNKHSLWKRISGKKKKKKNSTSSAFRNHFCQVGRLPKHYWKHSKTNKHLLRVRCCEEETAWRMIGSAEKLWRMNLRCNKKQERGGEGEGGVCLFVWYFYQPLCAKQYFDKISSQAE